MKHVVSITIILLMTFSYLKTFAQKKNDKKYKDGYIIRFQTLSPAGYIQDIRITKQATRSLSNIMMAEL
jgi:hypothetical protein